MTASVSIATLPTAPPLPDGGEPVVTPGFGDQLEEAVTGLPAGAADQGGAGGDGRGDTGDEPADPQTAQAEADSAPAAAPAITIAAAILDAIDAVAQPALASPGGNVAQAPSPVARALAGLDLLAADPTATRPTTTPAAGASAAADVPELAPTSIQPTSLRTPPASPDLVGGVPALTEEVAPEGSPPRGGESLTTPRPPTAAGESTTPVAAGPRPVAAERLAVTPPDTAPAPAATAAVDPESSVQTAARPVPAPANSTASAAPSASPKAPLDSAEGPAVALARVPSPTAPAGSVSGEAAPGAAAPVPAALPESELPAPVPTAPVRPTEAASEDAQTSTPATDPPAAVLTEAVHAEGIPRRERSEALTESAEVPAPEAPRRPGQRPALTGEASEPVAGPAPPGDSGLAPPGDAGWAPVEPVTHVVRSVGNVPETEVIDAVSSPTGTVAPAAPTISRAPSVQAVQAPGPVSSPPAAPPTSPVHQLANVVVEQINQGGGSARLVLDPPELGEIAIRISSGGDAVRIDVRVDRPETAALLREHQIDLTSLLGDRGLDLAELSLSTGSGRGFERELGEDTDDPTPGFREILEGEDQTGSETQTHNRLRAAYNPDGALLYRV